MRMMDNIKTELEEAIGFVENAQSELSDGKIIELQQLQENVAQICEILAAMPVEQGKEYRGQMLDLSKKMEDLEIDLRAKKIDVEREIRGANSNKNAASAYEKAKTGGQDDPNSNSGA